MDNRELNIIDSTLREGEQFARACFTPQQKFKIARLLDNFGVPYIELTSPLASPQSFSDCRTIASLGLKAKILTHTRCAIVDVDRALETGVDGINLVIGTSPQLRRHGHGKDMNAIIEQTLAVLEHLRGSNIEIRFSAEDSLRSSYEDLYRIYEAVDAIGVHRVGVADTVGIGTPEEIFELVSGLRQRIGCGIEFHGHNDTGCAVANAWAAFRAGADFIDTTVLGIGERNGITPLGGFLARLIVSAPHLVENFAFELLRELDQTVASCLNMEVPFNNAITSFCAFSHKAGIHTNAVLNHPESYEIFDPHRFGMDRQIHVGHKLTGRNAIRHRATELGLHLDDQQIRQLTLDVKAASDQGDLSSLELDQLLQTATQREVCS